MKTCVYRFGGYVLDITDEDTVWIRVYDLTFPDNPEEEMELYMDAISPEERTYLIPGVSFHWDFFDDDTYEFVFDKSVWTEEEIEELNREAEVMLEKIKQLRWGNSDE